MTKLEEFEKMVNNKGLVSSTVFYAWMDAKRELRQQFRDVMNELGVPQDGYFQTVTNAYEIAEKASADLS